MQLVDAARPTFLNSSWKPRPMRDPIVEEVRATRRKIEAECGGDFDAYCDYILRRQQQVQRGRLGDRHIETAHTADALLPNGKARTCTDRAAFVART